jgi:hypothetical protein
MNIDLDNLTLDQLAALKAKLDGLTSTAGRSPVRIGPYKDPRQLDNLTLTPTKDDPRPTFFWSSDAPRNVGDLTRTQPFPRLMWTPSGVEVSVASERAQRELEAEGYVLIAPVNAQAPDPMETMRQQLAMLKPEDQQLIVAAAKRDRMAKLQESLAGLSEEDLAAIVASVEPSKPKRST